MIGIGFVPGNAPARHFQTRASTRRLFLQMFQGLMDETYKAAIVVAGRADPEVRPQITDLARRLTLKRGLTRGKLYWMKKFYVNLKLRGTTEAERAKQIAAGTGELPVVSAGRGPVIVPTVKDVGEWAVRTVEEGVRRHSRRIRELHF